MPDWSWWLESVPVRVDFYGLVHPPLYQFHVVRIVLAGACVAGFLWVLTWAVWRASHYVEVTIENPFEG